MEASTTLSQFFFDFFIPSLSCQSLPNLYKPFFFAKRGDIYIYTYIIIYLQYIYYIQNVQTFSEHWRNKTTEFHLDFRGDEAQFGLIPFVRCHRDRVLCFLSHTGNGKDLPGTSRAVPEIGFLGQNKSAGCK